MSHVKGRTYNHKSERVTYKVFIGGLSVHCDDRKLRDYLETYGVVTECKITRDRDKMSKGYGFAVFKYKECADRSIGKNHVIDGKIFEIRPHVSREDNTRILNEIAKRKIFVSNLRESIKEKDLLEFFSAYGPVEDVLISRDAKTQLSRNFGFVVYQTEESALNSLSGRYKRKVRIRNIHILFRMSISKDEIIDRNSNDDDAHLNHKMKKTKPLKNKIGQVNSRNINECTVDCDQIVMVESNEKRYPTLLSIHTNNYRYNVIWKGFAGSYNPNDQFHTRSSDNMDIISNNIRESKVNLQINRLHGTAIIKSTFINNVSINCDNDINKSIYGYNSTYSNDRKGQMVQFNGVENDKIMNDIKEKPLENKSIDAIERKDTNPHFETLKAHESMIPIPCCNQDSCFMNSSFEYNDLRIRNLNSIHDDNDAIVRYTRLNSTLCPESGSEQIFSPLFYEPRLDANIDLVNRGQHKNIDISNDLQCYTIEADATDRNFEPKTHTFLPGLKVSSNDRGRLANTMAQTVNRRREATSISP